MSVWSGWQADLLAAAKFPNSTANRDFLTAWHQHATSNCTRNPVDISKQAGKWTACKHLDQGRTANNYGDQTSAEHAFAGQIYGGEFGALNSGFFNNSLSVSTASSVVIAEVALWGSGDFAAFLTQQSSNAGGGGSGVKAPGIHKGWTELRKSVNTNLPDSFRHSDKLARAALRSLSHARKVRL